MATIVNIRDFSRFVTSDVPKAPQSSVAVALVDALRDFCQKTYLWRRMSDWTDLLAGQSTYGFSSPDGTEMCGILHVDYRPSQTVQPYEVREATEDELSARRPGWRNETARALSQYISREPSIIQFVPYPSLTDGDQLLAFRVEVAMSPTMSATEVPEFLLGNWGAVIGAGAKARLLAQQKQPWSGDPTYFNRIYENGVASCRTRVSKSSTRKSLGMRLPTGV